MTKFKKSRRRARHNSTVTLNRLARQAFGVPVRPPSEQQKSTTMSVGASPLQRMWTSTGYFSHNGVFHSN